MHFVDVVNLFGIDFVRAEIQVLVLFLPMSTSRSVSSPITVVVQVAADLTAVVAISTSASPAELITSQQLFRSFWLVRLIVLVNLLVNVSRQKFILFANELGC